MTFNTLTNVGNRIFIHIDNEIEYCDWLEIVMFDFITQELWLSSRFPGALQIDSIDRIEVIGRDRENNYKEYDVSHYNKDLILVSFGDLEKVKDYVEDITILTTDKQRMLTRETVFKAKETDFVFENIAKVANR